MGTNDKNSQLCRMTRLTSRLWRGITLSRSTKLHHNLTHLPTDECCPNTVIPDTLFLMTVIGSVSKMLCMKTHKAIVYCNTP